MKCVNANIHLQRIACPDEEDMILKGPTEYYVVEKDGKRIGTAEIRLKLNEYMRKFGGNLGYSIIHKERNKGYGQEVLSQLLEICKTKKMDNILITCYEDNIPSKKMIEAAGGILDGIAADEQGKILRFRIVNHHR